jgi:ketosteroid isomerase-like protein
VGDARSVIDRLTAAQNAHDLEGMLACFHEDYRSEQPLHPARNFQGRDQVRAGTKADGTPFDERGVLVMGVRDVRLACGRLYADDVQPESADIDAVVRHMAGTEIP